MGIFGKKNTDAAVDEKQASTEVKKAKTAKKSQDKNAVVSFAGAYGVVEEPIVTEKSHMLATQGQYVFRVANDATKARVKKVITDLYKVDVQDVRLLNVKPKRRTVKYDRGYQKQYKKAIVTIAKGQHIAVFEGV